MEISVNNINNLRGVTRQKGEDKAALRGAEGVGEEKQREDEVLERGKGGTSHLISPASRE